MSNPTSSCPSARPQRHAPHRQAPPRQLHGRPANWVRLQDAVRVLLLHRRLARAHHRLRRSLADRRRTPSTSCLDYLAAGLDPTAPSCSSSAVSLSTPSYICSFRMVTPLGWLDASPATRSSRKTSPAQDLEHLRLPRLPAPPGRPTSCIYQADAVPVGQDQAAAR